MTGDRRPPTAPAGLWDRPEMAEALAQRDMGTVVRVFRRWTGASQNDVSMLVGVPQPHISELERGGRRVTALDVFERFADGLGIPRERLGLARRGSDQERHRGTGRNYRSDEEDQQVARSHEEWLSTRHHLAKYRPDLTHAVAKLYPEEDRLGDTGILMPSEWRLPAPIDLASIELTWEQASAPPVNGQHGETRDLRPLTAPGKRYSRYHRAVKDLDRPRLFENRVCHRLLKVRTPRGHEGISLGVTTGDMCYFDMVDVGEALAHEAARAAVDGSGQLHSARLMWEALPFRRMLRNPFDLTAYPLMLSISTLTIRQSASGTTFLLLRRDPKKVAIAGGMYSVIPTGVFQPASVLPSPKSPDFDLWRNMMREYSEEFLGNPEHDGDGPPIDYKNEEPFRSLDAGRRDGNIKVYCLGVGIDALNYVGDVFTVAVFQADFFDRMFEGIVEQNDEGDISLGHDDGQQFSFDEATVQRLFAEGRLAPSGAACLELAWIHRDAVLS